MTEINTFVKCLMERANLSQSELARMAGVSRSTLSKIIRGRNNGSVEALNKVLGVFDCYVTVRRRRFQTDDYDRDTGKLRLPFDDPLENNPTIDKILNRDDKTSRPK